MTKPEDKIIKVWLHKELVSESTLELSKNLAASNKMEAKIPREAMTGALAAVIDYFTNIGMSGPDLAILRHLRSALSDLDLGIQHPALRPEHKKGRSPETTAEWSARCLMSAAITALRYSGRGLNAAAREVMSEMKSLKQWRPSDSVKNILEWRKQLSKNSAQLTGEYAKTFERCNQLITEASKIPSPEERTSRLRSLSAEILSWAAEQRRSGS